MPKRDLVFQNPMMNGAGALGFAPDLRGPVPWAELGAFITNPISLRSRRAAAAPALLEFQGGFLLHTGLPNPGFRSVIRQYARRWKDAPMPVIVHLLADRPDETRRMVQALEGAENVMAVELGFAPLLAGDIILLVVEMCSGELPLIVSLPAEQVLELGSRALQSGAAALSIAPPRGAISRDGALVTGRLFGPSLLPRTLDVVHSAAHSGFPVIGAGGICSKADTDAMLAAGALAVQVDSALWLPRALPQE
ncbi:MAG TPA: nitronate monooxygenase [Anaerolineales bacterium]|nr:nitronate monooxygenase [Anaerolineales bacterium]